jgi:hypothetical protein
MRIRAAASVAVAGITAVLAACADGPEPAGPPAAIQAAPAAVQDRLPAWFAESWPAVLALPGTVFADHDEANGRLVFGVENAAAINGVRNALSRIGVPDAAFEVRITEPIYQAASLRDRWRPTRGGIQIHFSQYLCTLGFNADDGTERSFITNSHCTSKQGGVESTVYYQPTSSVDATAIATEVEDPRYFSGGACPRGRKCRWSDSARALYNTATSSTRGAIARTSGPNNGSLEVTGDFTVTSQDNSTTSFPIGTTINKVGRTTGWTQGTVTQTCVHTNVSGSNITQLCQTFVQGPGSTVVVGGGDSGSGVFRVTSGDNVQLVGILWGGSSNGNLFVFSPLKQVRDELGAITATN